MNDAASVVLDFLNLENSGFCGIFMPRIITASTAMTPEANSMRSQYILSIILSFFIP